MIYSKAEPSNNHTQEKYKHRLLPRLLHSTATPFINYTHAPFTLFLGTHGFNLVVSVCLIFYKRRRQTRRKKLSRIQHLLSHSSSPSDCLLGSK